LKRTGNIRDFLDDSDSALSNFRSGKLNLIIATSVLEEGLDVPECNLVICFEKPVNLKSFVQRRGRARHKDSKLVLLLDSRDKNLNEWQQLEADMKAMYEDEMRMLHEMALQEDVEEHDGRVFRIGGTNATLDLDSAVAHLHHFCSVLPSRDYVDLRPDFICSQENNLTRAKVILPISVHEEVRVSESKSAWINEKNAIKDAAFQAYVALYHAGLVNDNLLPLLKRDEVVDELMTSAVETRASLMVVNEQLNPWISVAQAWKSGIQPKQCAMTLGNLELQMYLPIEIPNIRSFSLYWDSKTNIIVTQTQQSVSADPDRLATALNETWAVLQASFGGRFTVAKKQVVVQFSVNHNLPPLLSLLGQKPASAQELFEGSGLIRDKMARNVPYLFQELLQTKPHIRDVQQPYVDYELIPENTPHISVKPLPKKADFLRKIKVQNQPESSKPYRVVLPVSRCTEDNMPFRFVQFGILMPHITRRYELYLIAQHLSNTLLKDVHISDMSVVVTAICASSANEETDYQRLEFLGDSILKMCTSVQLLATYPLWHEGYLSFKKDRLVANSRLARAAVDLGLDSFIITEAFNGHKWRPLFVENLLEATNEGKRQMSSKVLADVVEALIGASMIDGGLPKALSCLQIFLPELDWQQLSDRRDFLYHRIPNAELPSTFEPLENLIGYKFTKKALLTEAMTHVSCNTGSASLERLEFLGDSILDYIIVTTMYQHKLSHVQMHLLRTALVNADFLAFICMEWSTSQEVVELITSNDTSVPIFKEAKTVEVPLWSFMRHSSPQLGFLQVATMRRHADLRGDIRNAVEHGSHYPWALLARLQAHKFYSDLVESLLGALWIDSGSFDICREAVERMGILGYLRRILREGVHIWHPKEELGLVADVERIRYVLEVGKRVDKGDGGDNGVGNEYKCTIFVGEREIVSVSGGLSKEEVKTKAAELAVAIMKAGKERGVDKGSMKEAGLYVDVGDDLTMSGC
jgi:dsRNA-specific ribonuclease